MMPMAVARGARSRLDALKARGPRVAATQRTAGLRIQALWRTGLLPSAAHGAAVGGVADEHLATLRSAAAMICSGRGGVGSDSIALRLASQRDP